MLAVPSCEDHRGPSLPTREPVAEIVKETHRKYNRLLLPHFKRTGR